MRAALARIPLGRALIALGVVLVLINIASGVWDVRTAHERTERRAQRDFSNVTRVLAEQTAAALEAADIVLRDAARRRSTDGSQLPHLVAVLVFDGEGRLVNRGRAGADIDPALAERMYVEMRGRARSGLYLSDPYRGGAKGTEWRFVMVRAVPGGPTAAGRWRRRSPSPPRPQASGSGRAP